MNAQIFTTPNGERMVMLSEADYQLLLAAAEDAADSAAVRAFHERLEAGEEELLPAAMVERLLAGESPIRIWREHRGLSVSGLAQAAGLSQPYLSQIEAGVRRAAAEKLARIAQALHVQPDDLV